MRRLVSLAAGVVVTLATLAIPAPSQAQGFITVTRVYQEHTRDGCQTYVSQWTDGSYMVVPWICPPGVVPLRNDKPVPAIRSYNERGREGCIWYVAIWADGVYTGVPWQCPFGVAPIKPGTVPPAPPVYYGPQYPMPYPPYQPYQPYQPYGWHRGW